MFGKASTRTFAKRAEENRPKLARKHVKRGTTICAVCSKDIVNSPTIFFFTATRENRSVVSVGLLN